MRGFLETPVNGEIEDASPDDSAFPTTVVVACSAALLTLLPIAAHQLGCLRHLPDPAGKVFASDKITESAAAHPLGIPDGLLGLGSYGVTLALALSSRKSRKARQALGLKLLVDGSLASFNVVRQVVSFRRLCSWCTATALCTAAMVACERRTIRNQIAVMRERL